ncbi:MAG: leucyl/phenylalanyl-tRNA--protein transferase [Planctomycetota bacterium]|nr:leucyl/phenylalanyl-tRNA--protein transferase [Planctomycetota bacterium]
MRATLQRKAMVEALLAAYRQGAFPMADPDSGRIDFYTADPRGVFDLRINTPMRVSRSLSRRLRSGWFELRADTAFESVVRACAEPRRDDDRTWISERILEWSVALHGAGHAHSIETWRRDPATGEEALVGGVYGVCLGGAFFGESMFSRPRPRLASGERHPLDGTDASKVALHALLTHLKSRGYTLFDAQFSNPHIARLGCAEIPLQTYLDWLDEAIDADVAWGSFTPEPIAAA